MLTGNRGFQGRDIIADVQCRGASAAKVAIHVILGIKVWLVHRRLSSRGFAQFWVNTAEAEGSVGNLGFDYRVQIDSESSQEGLPNRARASQ